MTGEGKKTWIVQPDGERVEMDVEEISSQALVALAVAARVEGDSFASKLYRDELRRRDLLEGEERQ